MAFKTNNIEDFYFDGMAAWEEFAGSITDEGVLKNWHEPNVPFFIVKNAIALSMGKKTVDYSKIKSESFFRLVKKSQILYRQEKDGATQMLPGASAFMTGWNVASAIYCEENTVTVDFGIMGDEEGNVIFPSPTVIKSLQDFSAVGAKTGKAIADLLHTGTEYADAVPVWSEDKDRFLLGDDAFQWDAERGWIVEKGYVSHSTLSPSKE